MENHHNSTENRGFLDVSADQRRREGVSSVTKRNSEAPPTPGRPIFSFSTTGTFSRKSIPSKWDDAEKWLNGNNSCHDSPAHHYHHHQGLKPLEVSKVFKQFERCKSQGEVFPEKTRITEEKVTKSVLSIKGSIALENQVSDAAFNGVSASADVLLKGRKNFRIISQLPLLFFYQCTPSIAIQNALYDFHLFDFS